MPDSLRNIAIAEDLEAEWNRLNFQGEIHTLDRVILRAIFEKPGATTRELAETTGIAQSAIVRRMNKEKFIEARMLLEGTVSHKMRSAADKYARLINRTLDLQEEDPKEVIKALWLEFKDDKEAFKRAATLVEKLFDPQLAHEMGKVAVSFLAKEAELQMKAKEVADPSKKVQPMAVEEAKRILDTDFVMQPDEPLTVEEL